MIKKSLKDFFPGLIKKQTGTQQESFAEERSGDGNAKLKFIFFIVDWQKANIVSNVFADQKVRFHFTTMGRGTANSDILDLLGIGSTDKAIITCLEQDVGIIPLMKAVRNKIKSHGPGAGIAFSISLSAINDPVLLLFKQSIHNNESISNDDFDNGGTNMSDKISNDLILCVVNHGNSDELMNTARTAGARGGTVLNARGTAHEGVVKFFGVSVQDEKEIILILTKRDKKLAIMQAICEAHGLNSEAQGIVFSLPVDNVMGLSLE